MHLEGLWRSWHGIGIEKFSMFFCLNFCSDQDVLGFLNALLTPLLFTMVCLFKLDSYKKCYCTKLRRANTHCPYNHRRPGGTISQPLETLTVIDLANL